MSRVEKKELLELYALEDFTNIDDFLGQVARKRGQIMQGGIANFDQAARSVLRDFLNGKLKYYTAPPLTEDNDDDEEMN